MTMPPRVTSELFVIPHEGAYLIYAPLRQAAFLANAAMVNTISALQEGDHSDAGGDIIEFLRRLEIVDGTPEVAPITTFTGDPKPTTLTLFLTTACNLRCTYCYASAGDTPKRVMQFDVAKRGIDFVLANAVELGEQGIDIAYHGGGEPTGNWATLTESFEYAARRAEECDGLTVRAALATNGVLSDDRIEWIIEHLLGASVSFDGLPEVHDRHRLTISGQGSSALVMQTLRRFDAAGFHYGLRLTVTHDMISKLESSIRFICNSFNPDRIQVEPAYQLGRWSDAPSAETAEFITSYRAAQATARSYGKDVTFSGARLGTLTNHFCGISQDSFCLTADGQVSACYETFIPENKWSSKFFYGRQSEAADKGYVFNLPVLHQLRGQSVDRREFCQGCFVKWTCGGDCYHKALNVNGSTEFSGTDRCHIIRELTKDQILTKIREAGGVIWHEERSDARRQNGKESLL